MKVAIPHRFNAEPIAVVDVPDADPNPLRHAVEVMARDRRSLAEADLRGANLRGANLYGAKFRGADLSDSNLYGADLENTDFKGANLTGVIGLPSIPVVADLDRKILQILDNGLGKLDMRDYHTDDATICNTTHCLAGFAIDLAGSAGYVLEDQIGSSAAGAFIYFVSTGQVPDFFTDNDTALHDLRVRAGGAQ